MSIARRAADRLSSAKVLATEIGSLDATDKAEIFAQILQRALDRDEDTLAALAAEERSKIEAVAASKNLPSAFAHHLKPWFLALLTATPDCEAKREGAGLQEMDEYLAAAAAADGLRVVALETIGEQVDVISSIAPEIVTSLIDIAVREPKLNDDVYATMLKLYAESRPAEILPLADAAVGLTDKERRTQDEFMRALLVGRNETMAERALPLLATGGAFIAVGALHLTGKEGLIERFRRMDYTVTREW
jgi:uncharacterized protein YbaP (TraB family)